jgi:LEA14-like dessication related protein
VKRFLPSVAALSVVLAACTGAPSPNAGAPDPDLVLLKHTIEPGVCETTMRLFFALKNPRQTPLRLLRVESTVTQNGTPIDTTMAPIDLLLQPTDEAAFDVAVAIPRGACKRPSSQAASLPVSNADHIEVVGKIFATSGEELVFEFEDTDDMPLERDLELKLSLRGQRADKGRIELYAVLNIYNPNGFGLTVDLVTYEVRVGGRLIAQGIALEHDRLRDLAKAVKEVALDIDMTEPAMASLLKSGKLSYEIEATVKIGDSERKTRQNGAFSF